MATKKKISTATNKTDEESGTVSTSRYYADDALPFLQSYEHAIVLSEDAEKNLLKKIDLIILPLLFVVGFLQFLDKSLRKLLNITPFCVRFWRANIGVVSYANVMGLAKDTHSDAAQFSYLATAFYVAYFIFELPSSYLIQRLPVAKYIGLNGKFYQECQVLCTVC